MTDTDIQAAIAKIAADFQLVIDEQNTHLQTIKDDLKKTQSRIDTLIIDAEARAHSILTAVGASLGKVENRFVSLESAIEAKIVGFWGRIFRK